MDSVFSHLLFSHMLSAEGSQQKRKPTNQFRTPAATVAASKGSTHRPRHSRGLDKEDGKMTDFYPALLHSEHSKSFIQLASFTHSYKEIFIYFFAQVLSILYSHPDECIGEHLRVSILPKSTCSLDQPVCNHKLPISRRPMLPPELQPQMEKLQLLIHSGDHHLQ